MANTNTPIVNNGCLYTSDGQRIRQVLTALAEGLGIRATARVFNLDPNTVAAWLHQAGQQMTAVSHYLIHDLHLAQVQSLH